MLSAPPASAGLEPDAWDQSTQARWEARAFHPANETSLEKAPVEVSASFHGKRGAVSTLHCLRVGVHALSACIARCSSMNCGKAFKGRASPGRPQAN